MPVIWERYPSVAENDRAREWLQIQSDLGLARNAVEAYGRSLEDYLRFCGRRTDVVNASKADIAGYVGSLSDKNPHDAGQPQRASRRVLSNATIQLRLTAVRLFYDYLVEEGQRLQSPVARGRYTLVTVSAASVCAGSSRASTRFHGFHQMRSGRTFCALLPILGFAIV